MTGRKREDAEVALWYMRYGAPDYSLHDSEEEAARDGAWMTEDGGGSVLGVQFPDGRLIERGNWAAFATAQRWLEDEYHAKAAAEAARPPRPTRRILDPFGGRQLTVDDGEPDWVGRTTFP